MVDGAYVTWTLRRRGLRPLLGRDVTGASADPERARALASAVDAGLGLLPVVPTCLRRSVTLLRELGRAGVSGALHVGVRHVDERLEAHAWVQVGDEVVNDDADLVGTYTRLAGGEVERLLPMLR